MVAGVVRYFDEKGAFAILAREGGGEDVFCHYTAILADGCFRSVGEGQRVEFEVSDGPHGPIAANVRRVFDASGALVTVLCGDAVQVRTRSWGTVDLPAAAERLRGFGEVRLTPVFVRLRAAARELTLFDDGRAIVKGTGDGDEARTLVATWLGIKLRTFAED